MTAVSALTPFLQWISSGSVTDLNLGSGRSAARLISGANAAIIARAEQYNRGRVGIHSPWSGSSLRYHARLSVDDRPERGHHRYLIESNAAFDAAADLLY